MQVEKNISFLIEQQFPAIYRENGRELIAIIEDYYRWLETNEDQSTYNARRLFEYRDIDTTLSKMLLFFKNKFLSDLPFNEETVRFIVKNIMSLYRRRGTTEGLELFFRIFFQTEVDVYFPARDILKPSASEWRVGSYLQLFSNSGRFYSTELDTLFTYADLSGRTISGSISKATAIVDKINLITLNNMITPILYLNNMKGTFQGFDDITTKIDGVLVPFGRVYGSVDDVIIDQDYKGSTGNSVGDLLTISGSKGTGCQLIVTDVNESFTGEISYTIEDGGFGYTKENTKLLVSNQSIKYSGNITNGLTKNSDFNVLERVEDQFGNQATVIGFDDNFIGFRLDANNEFSNTSNISTLDRDVNFTAPAADIFPGGVTEKNDSSPGFLYPETSNTAHVKLDELENSANVSLIIDIIGDFANVALNSNNYNDVPPALAAMSGNTDPVTIDTTLEEAFDLAPFEIGTIKEFININPGTDYVNDVFAVAYDPVIDRFDRYSQTITLDEINAAMSIGDVVSQGSTEGKILSISGKNLIVLPYSYYGFNLNDPLVYKGNNYNILEVAINYGSNEFGFNSSIIPKTEFATGRILEVKVLNSGFGYADEDVVDIIDSNGSVAAKGTIQSRGTGITGGFWSTIDSHLNGYILDGESLDYFNASKYIQDSDFYQEYSYQIISNINRSEYSELYDEVMHVSGTKFFSRFRIEDFLDTSRNINLAIKFLESNS